jgi:arylsulfatase
LRQGPWKIVWDKAGEKQWELYDLNSDRCETMDLAHCNPARVERMSADWFAWAKKVGVKLKDE